MLKQSKNIIPLLCILFLFTGCSIEEQNLQTTENHQIITQEITSEYIQTTKQQEMDSTPTTSTKDVLKSIPKFSGPPYVILNDNIPDFTDEDKENTTAFEYYSNLDNLGRCGVAYANICEELMPTEERGAIGSVKPTGWHLVKYDIVDGKYLFNRCHLIGFQLAGENANEKNLITGTRYLNIEGMLPFENAVADYVGITGNHVLYRVTPIFKGKNLVAAGVQMEAYSVEDKGAGVCFNVFAFNNQPGITIDYATGESWISDEAKHTEETTIKKQAKAQKYILNINTKKFHFPTCSSVKEMAENNRKEVTNTREKLIEDGYDPCHRCNP